MPANHSSRFRPSHWILLCGAVIAGSLLPVSIAGATELPTAAITPEAPAHLYWINNGTNAIGKSNINGTGINQSFITEDAEEPAAIAVSGPYIYRTNTNNDSIIRETREGTERDENFITGAEGSVSIAVNNSYIYWANGGNDKIGRAKIDGTEVNKNFITGASEPNVLAIDSSHIYWANYGENSIGRANLDGSEVEQSFITGDGLTYGIAVNGSYIYWSDTVHKTIARASLNGSNVEDDFITGADFPLGVALDGSNIYWGNLTNGGGTGSIARANIDGTEANENFITGANRVYDVAIGTEPVLNFGNQGINTGPTASQEFTLTNTSSVDLHISSLTPVAISGVNAEEFNITSDACSGVTVAPGGTCTVAADFSPTSLGEATATLTFTDDASDSPQTATLTGTGTGTLVNTVPPTIIDETSGNAYRAGDTLSASTGTWTGTAPITYAYQWETCNASGGECSDVAVGGTSSTYTLTEADVGLSAFPKTIKAVITASNEANNGVSAETSPQEVSATEPEFTGQPTIPSYAIVGETLTVTGFTVSAIPAPTVSYQWYVGRAYSGTPIAGATHVSYEVTSEDLGDEIYVVVSASNEAYAGGSDVGAGTDSTHPITTTFSAPENLQPPGVFDVTHAGAFKSGDSLTASAGIWVGEEPITYKYQWTLYEGSTIVGTICGVTSSCTLSEADVGTAASPRSVYVIVTAENIGGAESGSSIKNRISAIPASVTQTPTITGSPVVGQTLTVGNVAVAGSPTPTVSYEWSRCASSSSGPQCTNIAGAAASTYTPTAADIGDEIVAVVIADNSAYYGGADVGSQTAFTSEVTPAVVAPVNTTPPTITDQTSAGAFKVGDELVATTGTWTGSPTPTYTYQWQLCLANGSNCTNIAGARSETYTIADADVGHQIQVRVKAENSVSEEEAASGVTPEVKASKKETPVAPVTPVTPTEVPKITTASEQGKTEAHTEAPHKVCTKSALVLTEALADGHMVTIKGVAALGLNGDTVLIKGMWNGKVVKTGPIKITVHHGAFTVNAPLPPRGILHTNRARYIAVISGVATSNDLKVTRRLQINQQAIKIEGEIKGIQYNNATGVSIKGRVTGYLTKPRAPLYLTEYNPAECNAKPKIVGAYRLGKHGHFAIHFVPSTNPAPIVYRLQTEVAAGSKGKVAGETFSAPLPLNVAPLPSNDR
jgi:virginiamycin B lyase